MEDMYELHPTIVWELTRACDLHCRGCPTGANDRPGPNELTTYEAYKTVDQIATVQPRELTISGGDPLQREDVYQIIDYARRRGLDPALAVSPTSELTQEALARLQRNGLSTIIFSIDGSTAELHQALHGVPATFAATLLAIRWAEMIGFRIEINTLVWRRNANDLDAIAELIRPFRIARWNVHFVVPIGASREIEMLTGDQVEDAFGVLDAIREREAFAVRVVEAPQYRRFRLQRHLVMRLRDNEDWSDFAGYEIDTQDTARELLDSAREGARGFLYISHAGDVRASEFVPQSAGNLRYRPLGAIYRGSDLFVALRDPDNLKGRCQRCEFRHVCGGSRARAFAMTGDLFGSDPLCVYDPPR